MHWREYVDRIVKRIENEPSIEGAFLGGSLVTGKWDEFSDIDLGIATRNRPRDLQKAFSLRDQIAALVGDPVHRLEKAWGHSMMIALLYGKSQFPPIGFELDVFFSQLRHVSEQMPGASFGIVFDRAGRLRQELDRLSQVKLGDEIRAELMEQMTTFPFDSNHAAKAQARGDLFNFQFVLERMRAAVFSAAASRQGGLIRGSKRASRYLSACEREIIQRSYHEFAPETSRQLQDLYVFILTQVQRQYDLKQEVEHLRSALPEIS